MERIVQLTPEYYHWDTVVNILLYLCISRLILFFLYLTPKCLSKHLLKLNTFLYKCHTWGRKQYLVCIQVSPVVHSYLVFSNLCSIRVYALHLIVVLVTFYILPLSPPSRLPCDIGFLKSEATCLVECSHILDLSDCFLVVFILYL